MLEVLEQFRVIFKSIRRHYRSVEERSGISGALLWALAQVAANPGSQVGDLARALAIHQSTASNLLRRLGSRGLVARRRQAKDQRAVQLFATAKGLRTLKRAPQRSSACCSRRCPTCRGRRSSRCTGSSQGSSPR